MSGHPHPGVDIAGVVAVDVAARPPQPVLVAGHRDDVEVVGHQAIGPDRHLRPRRRLGYEIEVERIIAILEEHPLAPVAPLGDMMGDAWEHDAGESCHWLRLSGSAAE